ASRVPRRSRRPPRAPPERGYVSIVPSRRSRGAGPGSAGGRTRPRGDAGASGRARAGATPAALDRGWWTVAALIAALACALYANSLHGELVFDDVNAVVNNSWVRSGDVAGIVTQ